MPIFSSKKKPITQKQAQALVDEHLLGEAGIEVDSVKGIKQNQKQALETKKAELTKTIKTEKNPKKVEQAKSQLGKLKKIGNTKIEEIAAQKLVNKLGEKFSGKSCQHHLNEHSKQVGRDFFSNESRAAIYVQAQQDAAKTSFGMGSSVQGSKKHSDSAANMLEKFFKQDDYYKNSLTEAIDKQISTVQDQIKTLEAVASLSGINPKHFSEFKQEKEKELQGYIENKQNLNDENKFNELIGKNAQHMIDAQSFYFDQQMREFSKSYEKKHSHSMNKVSEGFIEAFCSQPELPEAHKAAIEARNNSPEHKALLAKAADENNDEPIIYNDPEYSNKITAFIDEYRSTAKTQIMSSLSEQVAILNEQMANLDSEDNYGLSSEEFSHFKSKSQDAITTKIEHIEALQKQIIEQERNPELLNGAPSILDNMTTGFLENNLESKQFVSAVNAAIDKIQNKDENKNDIQKPEASSPAVDEKKQIDALRTELKSMEAEAPNNYQGKDTPPIIDTPKGESKLVEIASLLSSENQFDKLSDLMELNNFHEGLEKNGDSRYKFESPEQKAEFCTIIQNSINSNPSVSNATMEDKVKEFANANFGAKNEQQTHLQEKLDNFMERHEISKEALNTSDTIDTHSASPENKSLLSSFEKSVELMKKDKEHKDQSPSAKGPEQPSPFASEMPTPQKPASSTKLR